MSDADLIAEPPVAHARIAYLGPVAPHWEVYGDYGDRKLLDEFSKRGVLIRAYYYTALADSGRRPSRRASVAMSRA